MNLHSPRIRRFLWGLLSLLAAGAWPDTTAAQTADHSYADKLFGGRYSFTVKSDEVMVRLARQPGGAVDRAAAERLGTTEDLEIVRDQGLDDHRFVVYSTAGKSAASVAATLSAAPGVARAYPALLNSDGSTRYFLPDEVVVQFRPTLSEDAMLAQIDNLGSEVVIDHWTPGFYTVSVPGGRDVFDHVRAFIDLPDVRFAELSTISFDDALFVPDDPLYTTQWGFDNPGGGGFTAGADADLEDAWDLERGDPNVIVAIIDTGVDWAHPDLQPNILQNLGEDANGNGQTMIFNGASWVPDPGDVNGFDDDGNGQIDDFFGWDFASGDNDPDPVTTQTGHGHGTACAGLAAGVGDNGQGISGVAPSCRILPLRVNLTSGQNQNRADAINYAVAQAPGYGAMILSCSWRASSGSTISIENAVNDARAADVLPMFASGNSDNALNFPANLASAMAIGATSPCDERKSPTSCDGEDWWGSCFGAGLSVGAPGVLMQTTDVIGGGYAAGSYVANFNGTSSATPFAAGIAALVQSKALELHGASIPADQVQQIIEDSAEQVGGHAYPGGISDELGHGRVNAFEALNRLIVGPVVEILPPPVDVSLSIDRSFSMVGDPIVAAENAAAQVVRLLDVGDRIAVTSYSGGTDPGGLPDWPAWTDFPTTTIAGEADKDAAIAAIETGGNVYNLTAIGEGLKTARQELYSATPAQYPQSIILLSDGNNTFGPDPLTLLPLPAPEPTVYTIGFGPFADAATLEGLAMGTGGQYYFAGGTGSKTMGGTLPIIQTYQLSLMQATARENLGWVRGQIRDQGEDRHVFPVDSSCDQVLIGLLWGHLDPEAFQLFLQDPAGNVFEAGSPEWIGDETVSAFRIDRPEPGEWLALVRRVGGGEGSGNYHLNLAGSSRVQSQLTLIPRGWSQPLGMELRLFQLTGEEGVVPLRGAQVLAAVTYPNGEFNELELNDDDQDGVYSATVQNTFDSGSFTVETSARGETVEGDAFTRYDLASTVLLRDAELPPVTVDLPHLVGLPETVLDAAVVATPLLDQYGVGSFELGFVFDSDVVRFLGLGDPQGTLTENWNVQADDQGGEAVIIAGEGPELTGDGILLRARFALVGSLGDSSPIAMTQLELRTQQGNQVPSLGHDGSAAVESPIIDQVPVPYPLASGWSLRSLPVVLGEGEDLQQQLPQIESLLGWTGSEYQPITAPAVGHGFWLDHGGPDDLATVTGDPLGTYTRALPAGWSLIAATFEQSAVPELGEHDHAFTYDTDRGYVPAESLVPGQGTWYYAAEPTTLTVPADNGEPTNGAARLLTQAELSAVGEQQAGIPSTNHVVIGADASVALQVPYPPAPPAYTTLLRLLDQDDPTLGLYRDDRTGTDGESWYLEVLPGGNVGGAGTDLTWSPAALVAIADLPWVLYDGLGTGGPVLVADMRDQDTLPLTGAAARQFTIAVGAPTAVDDATLPTAYHLAGNHPNPFNPMTTIRYDVPRSGRMTIDVFDVRGRKVTTLVDRVVPAGRHSVVWDGRGQDGATVPSGIYFSRLTADGGVRITDRMTLLK
jgi:hypothetical protein